MQKIKFAVACYRFFGRKSGQTMVDFNTEVKALTDTDKAEIAPLLSVALGVEVEL